MGTIIRFAERAWNYVRCAGMLRVCLPLPLWILGVVLITTTSFCISLRLNLKRHITQTSFDLSHTKEKVADLPAELLESPEDFRILHERDKIALPGYHIREADLEREFTLLLRQNMLINRNMPQTWVFWFLLLLEAERRRTFTKKHLLSLDFKPGDVSCGVFRVVKREPGEVVMKMVPPSRMAAISGLLIVRLQNEVLASELVQWMPKSAGKALPVEKWVGKFLHEITAWRVLIAGKKLLQLLRENEDRHEK